MGSTWRDVSNGSLASGSRAARSWAREEIGWDLVRGGDEDEEVSWSSGFGQDIEMTTAGWRNSSSDCSISEGSRSKRWSWMASKRENSWSHAQSCTKREWSTGASSESSKKCCKNEEACEATVRSHLRKNCSSKSSRTRDHSGRWVATLSEDQWKCGRKSEAGTLALVGNRHGRFQADRRSDWGASSGCCARRSKVSVWMRSSGS